MSWDKYDRAADTRDTSLFNSLIRRNSGYSMNTAGYADNRNLFDNIALNQARTIADRKAYATAYSAASGGSGSKTARDALVDSTAGARPVPPAPPRKPTAPAPYTDPRLTLDRNERKAKETYVDVYGMYEDFTADGGAKAFATVPKWIKNYTGYEGPLLSPARMDQLASSAASSQAQYDTDIAEWNKINTLYQDNIASATAYNAALGADTTDRKESTGIAKAKAATAGRQGGGGSGELGVSQGAKNMSPGLGLVKRPESVWI